MNPPTQPPERAGTDPAAGAGPTRWTTDSFVISVAEQMAGPFWRTLSDDQRRRMQRYAAGYVARSAQRMADAADPVPGSVFDGLDDRVKRQLMQATLDATVYRTRLHLLLAYLASRDDTEIQAYELRTLAKLGEADPDSLPFF